jgi:hypothetical protein
MRKALIFPDAEENCPYFLGRDFVEGSKGRRRWRPPAEPQLFGE